MRARQAAVILIALAVAAGAQVNNEAQLTEVRRIHVERLNGGETADQIRDMIISRILGTGLFQLTEDPERADAILRGSAEDLVYNETFESRDGVDARGSFTAGADGAGSNRRGGFSATSSIGEDDSSRIVERRHEAMAAVRLVNKEGGVLWATVQESKGTKFTGASADVAGKVARQLANDYERARKQRETPARSDDAGAKE
jgi:hypothetical protein